MHVQIVYFHLSGMDEAEYRKMADELAPTFGALPGLISKVWLADPASSTYGGIYTWEDRQAMEAYLASDLFAAVKNHPNLENVTSRDYGILEGPTRANRGLIGASV
jgi:quinol monooxygenase YgiN